jgi:hypothetical protein
MQVPAWEWWKLHLKGVSIELPAWEWWKVYLKGDPMGLLALGLEVAIQQN